MFQSIISGDGFMVFKPSFMKPLQRSRSLFQSIISGDGYIVFKPHHFWRLYRGGAVIISDASTEVVHFFIHFFGGEGVSYL